MMDELDKKVFELQLEMSKNVKESMQTQRKILCHLLYHLPYLIHQLISPAHSAPAVIKSDHLMLTFPTFERACYDSDPLLYLE